VVAQPRFIQNKDLVLLVVVPLVCNVVAAFLHAMVPGIVVAIILAIVPLIGAISAVVRTIQSVRAPATR
jgi:hypothetical protein